MKSQQIIKLNPKEIQFDPEQPRKSFKEEDIEKQALTYDTQGIINMPEVRKVKDKYICATGELRIRAAIYKKLRQIEVKELIDYTEQEIRERQMIENLHLHKLEPIEIENAVVNLYEKYYKGNGGMIALAKLLGYENHKSIERMIKAHKIRIKYEGKLGLISTTSAYDLSTLTDREQEKVVAQLEHKVISTDLHFYIPKLKNLSSEVKDATLRVNDPIKIEDALFIEKFKPEEKKLMINWTIQTKKNIRKEAEYRLKVSTGEITPQIILRDGDLDENEIEIHQNIFIKITHNYRIKKIEIYPPKTQKNILNIWNKAIKHITKEVNKYNEGKTYKLIERPT